MSIGINGLNSYVDPSMVSAASGTSLSGKLDGVDDSASADELKEVCREFESYFMEQVYKEMFKTVGTEENGDSSLASLVDYFKDGVIQTVASQTTEQSGGPLAQQLYEQMKRNYGITEETSSDKI